MSEKKSIETITYENFARDIELELKLPKNTGLATNHGGSFLEMFRETDTLPFYYQNATAGMAFSDMIWDFSEYKLTNVPDQKLILNFGMFPKQFVDIAKLFTLDEIMKMKQKIQSIKKKVFFELKPFLIYAAQHGCHTMLDLSEELVTDYLDLSEKIKKETGMIRIRSTIKQFVDFYSDYYTDISYILPQKIEKNNYRLAKAQKRESRTPDIPEEYFTLFINRMLEIMQDKRQTSFMRSIASEIVIVSQTGLRISEALMLKCDDLYEEEFEDGKKFPVLRYPTYKGVRGVPTYKFGYTYANEITRAAITVLKDVHGESRMRQKCDFLFTETWSSLAGGKGIDPDTFATACERFFINIDSEKMHTIELSMAGIECLERKRVHIGARKRKIFYPRMHMFRVHMCTALRKNNVPRIIVERMMGHLESEMDDGYYRDADPDKGFQEDYGFSNIVLEELQEKEIPLLGGDEKNRKAIKDFVMNGKVRVAGSPDEVIQSLEDDLCIRPKAFGMCITAPRHSCGREIKTNKLLCYNGLCGNDFHMYFNLAANWGQFKTRKLIILKSCFQGYFTEAEQQIKYLVRLVNERMVDEFISLEELVKLKGTQELVLRHPELETVFDEYEDIKIGVELWKNMTLELFLEQNNISE